jgi:MFS transporter, DHA1 family, multidrug resistance protein
MILSPLSELPYIGRSPIYIITLAIVVILQVPTALSKNLGALLPLRFLAGFIGSPILATGGASLSDVFNPADGTAVIGFWGVAGTGGPTLGPIIGGYVAEAKGWTWTIWVLMWISAGALAILAFALPETSAQAYVNFTFLPPSEPSIDATCRILYRRAQRLRRLTGNHKLRTQAERDGMHLSVGDLAMTTFVRPFILGFTEPMVFAWNLYGALLYGMSIVLASPRLEKKI